MTSFYLLGEGGIFFFCDHLLHFIDRLLLLGMPNSRFYYQGDEYFLGYY
jgi:hypothetical protein